MKYKVVEIFDSIDGEGIRTGMTASFVRLAGCNLRCSYCDTLYALFGENEPCRYIEMTAEEIVNRVKYKRVTITGGEPMIAPGITDLIKAFAQNGCEVNIETNGAADITPAVGMKNVFFTIDYKLPSSGECDKMRWENFLKLKKSDVVKFVVGSDEDLEKMLATVKRLKKECNEMPQLFAGAVFGKPELKRLTEFILENDELSEVRVQIQLHKLIWNPDARGV